MADYIRHYNEDSGQWEVVPYSPSPGGGDYFSDEAAAAIVSEDVSVDPATGAYQPRSETQPQLLVAPIGGLASAVTGKTTPLAPVGPGIDIASVIDPGAYDAFKQFVIDKYGSMELGQVRFSSSVLENGPSGVRIGTLPRIVIADEVEGYE